jgi:pantothenate synthetase
MTPTEKAVYTDRAHSLRLSLGQFFREAGAAYTTRNAEAETPSLAEAEALEAALRQLELSTTRTEQTLDAALAEVKAALGAQP